AALPTYPLTATLGLAYGAGDWSTELAGRFVGRRGRLPTPPEGVRYHEAPDHAVLDLYARWRFAPGARVQLGVFSLTGKTYWPSGSVPLVSAGSATVDRYTAPGRNLAASLSVEW